MKPFVKTLNISILIIGLKLISSECITKRVEANTRILSKNRNIVKLKLHYFYIFSTVLLQDTFHFSPHLGLNVLTMLLKVQEKVLFSCVVQSPRQKEKEN